MNKLFNKDCFDVLPTLQDESIDLVLTDAPYNANYLSNSRKEKYKPLPMMIIQIGFNHYLII